MKLWCLLFLFATWFVLGSSVDLKFGDGEVRDDLPEINNWFHRHKPVVFDSFDLIDARVLFKAGVGFISNTQTFIIPDGDYVDLSSFDGVKVHKGDYFKFAEYDLHDVVLHEEKAEKLLGTGLDNTRSSVTNKISYAVSVSCDTATSVYADYGFVFGPILSGNYMEIDTSFSRSKTISVTCDVLPGRISYVKAITNLAKYGNIKKRSIGIEIGKRNYFLGKHSYSLDVKDWEVTELEYIKDLRLYCLEVGSSGKTNSLEKE